MFDSFYFTFILLVFLLAFWLYRQWLQIRFLQQQVQSAELAQLKTRINPNFFVSSLKKLQLLANSNNPHTADFIFTLSQFMRYLLYKGKQPYQPLSNEFEHLKNYIWLLDHVHNNLSLKLDENLFNTGVESDLKFEIPSLSLTFITEFIVINLSNKNVDTAIKVNVSAQKVTLEYIISAPIAEELCNKLITYIERLFQNTKVNSEVGLNYNDKETSIAINMKLLPSDRL